MSGFLPLLRLRALEILRTWRLWVLPAAIVFFAASGPLITRFTKELLAAALGVEETDGLPFPEPTAAAAAAQWASDLTQIVLLVTVVLTAGAISGEVRSGVASMLLVKPATRASYVLSHAAAAIVFALAAGMLGALVNWLVTVAVFGAAPLGPVLAVTAVWAVLAAVLLSAVLLASAAVDSFAGAAGIGIGVYFLLTLLGIIPQLAEHSPAGLVPLAGTIAAGTQRWDHTLWWPIGTGLLLAALLLTAAVAVFRRRELP